MLSSKQGLYIWWTKFLIIIWNTLKSSKLMFHLHHWSCAIIPILNSWWKRKDHLNSVFEKKFIMIWNMKIYCQKECLRFLAWNIISKFDSWNNFWKFLTNLILHQSWLIRKLKIQKHKNYKIQNIEHIFVFLWFLNVFGFSIFLWINFDINSNS